LEKNPVTPAKKVKESSLSPTLRFTPQAWAKLLYLRDAGETEVGMFGVCPNSPLLVEDVQLVRQICSWASVKFDDASVADYFEQQVEEGLSPDRFARVWIHTHPGDSAHPSHTDEETFARVFGAADWAVMFILACGGETYARLRVNGGPGDGVLLPTVVDFHQTFDGSQHDEWEQEYQLCVEAEPEPVALFTNQRDDFLNPPQLDDFPNPFLEESDAYVWYSGYYDLAE